MTISCYRIVKKSRAETAFEGEGARLYAGRWNSKNYRMVYTSSSLSLAILEIFVHLESYDILCKQYCQIRATFPKRLCKNLDTTLLKPGWNADIPINLTRDIGNKWLKKRESVVLGVPSVLVPTELNYLINLMHQRFPEIEISPPESFVFPGRLAQ